MRNSSPESLLTGLGLCDYSHSTHYGTSWAATVMYNAHGQGSQIPRALCHTGQFDLIFVNKIYLSIVQKTVMIYTLAK